MTTANPLAHLQLKPEFQPDTAQRPGLPQVLAPNEHRDWMLSSLELREGAQVREILETLPMELWDLL